MHGKHPLGKAWLHVLVPTGLAKAAPEKAAKGGADASADIDTYSGATLVDKVAAAAAQHA